MNIYEPGTDNFSKEWLDYLGSLRVQVFGDAKVAFSYDGDRLVRVQIWIAQGEGRGRAHAYYELPLAGWMEPSDV